MTKNRDLKTGQGKAYDVGYGKPPKATQFKKGQSGNAGGRPRKKGTEGIDVISVIEQPIPVKIDGAKRSMHPFEAGIRQLVVKALKGEKNTRSLIDLLKQFEVHGCFEPPEKVQKGGVMHAPKGISPAELIRQSMIAEGHLPDDKDKSLSAEVPEPTGEKDDSK